MRTRPALFAFVFAASYSLKANARELVTRVIPGEQRVYVTAGLDPAIVAGVGYLRAFEVQAIDRTVALGAELTLPVVLPGKRHLALDVASRVPLLERGPWALINRLALGYRATENAQFAGDTLLLDETVLAGWFGGRGFIAAELGWDHMLLTSLRPTDRYRAIHPAAPGAWFANTGGHLRAGVQGGWSVGRFELGLRFGMVSTETTAQPFLPFFVDLGAGVRF